MIISRMMNMTTSKHMDIKFHFGYNEIVMFDSFHISGILGLCVAVAGCFMMGFISESLKFGRENFHKHLKMSMIGCKYQKVPAEASDDMGESDNSDRDDQKVMSVGSRHSSQTISGKNRLLLTLLYLVQVILSYSLMLGFMTYNVWLCGAIIMGMVVGYVVWGSTDCY